MKKILFLEQNGRRWTKGDKDRIYLNNSFLKRFIKVEKTGENWNEYKINDVDISNFNASGIRRAIEIFVKGQLYDLGFHYNVADETLYFNCINSLVSKIAKLIEESINAELERL
jgi:hypothetical protein